MEYYHVYYDSVDKCYYHRTLPTSWIGEYFKELEKSYYFFAVFTRSINAIEYCKILNRMKNNG